MSDDSKNFTIIFKIPIIFLSHQTITNTSSAQNGLNTITV